MEILLRSRSILELTDLAADQMWAVKKEAKMTQGFWPEQLKEWGCRLLRQGENRERGRLRQAILGV